MFTTTGSALCWIATADCNVARHATLHAPQLWPVVWLEWQVLVIKSQQLPLQKLSCKDRGGPNPDCCAPHIFTFTLLCILPLLKPHGLCKLSPHGQIRVGLVELFHYFLHLHQKRDPDMTKGVIPFTAESWGVVIFQELSPPRFQVFSRYFTSQSLAIRCHAPTQNCR